MAEHNDLGKQGEQLAQRYLLKNNYQIQEINWQYKHLEVDIFAIDNKTFVAVEVKTRRSDFVENLSEIVNKKKQRFIIEATNAYIEKHDIDYEVRFDIIYIVIKNGKYYLKHITDAFSAIG